jgi:anti-sigma-K factor RskA
MSTGAIIAIVIIVALIAVAAVAIPQLRRARMRRQFGAEYDRLVKELGTKKADAELSARQRRADELGIKPLSAEQQKSYADDWTAVQERFVDAPAEAVSAADALIWDVMGTRGYPADDRDASMEALSVYHGDPLQGYRQVREVKLDSATTEDLRQALIRCRALFEDLLGEQAGTANRRELTARSSARTAGTKR